MPIDSYGMITKRKIIVVNDLMQTHYTYYLTETIGRGFHADFRPELTPAEMLELGVFGGKYMTDCVDEFPHVWFRNAKLCHDFHDPALNYYGVNASQPLSYWKKKAGSMRQIPEDGFSGTAGIIWAADAPTTSARSKDGRQ